MVKSRRATSERLTPEEFVLRAIPTLRTGRSKGINVVRSGFNDAFRAYFGEEADPIEVTTRMRKSGLIAVFLTKGAVVLYLREELKPTTLAQHDADWEKRDKADPPEPKPQSSKTEVSDDPLSKILKD